MAIDRVHGDGSLPTITVRQEALTYGRQGTYRLQPSGAPHDIVIAPTARFPGLTLVHEVGHLLDHQSLGEPSVLASIGHGDLADWRGAVRASEACRTLATLRRDAGSAREAIYFDYLLRDEEVWARCYEQYVAQRAQDLTLGGELHTSRKRVLGAIYTPRHWDDDDFRVIADEIDAIFWRRGWII